MSTIGSWAMVTGGAVFWAFLIVNVVRKYRTKRTDMVGLKSLCAAVLVAGVVVAFGPELDALLLRRADALNAMARSESNSDSRRVWAIQQLGSKVGDPDAFAVLSDMVRDAPTMTGRRVPDALRLEAVDALAAVVDEAGLAEVLSWMNDQGHQRFFEPLLRHPAARQHAIDLLDSHRDPAVRRHAAIALGASADPGAVQALLRVLPLATEARAATADGDAEVRIAAMAALALRQDDGVYEALVVGLGAALPREREEAARALGLSKNRQADEALRRVYEAEKSYEVRAATLIALGQRRATSVVQFQSAALRPSEIPAMRIAGVRSIAASDGAAGVGRLASVLAADRELMVRRAVLQVLVPLTGAAVDDAIAASLPVDDLKNADVVGLLQERPWRPRTEQQRVYWWLTSKDGAALLAEWDTTKRVLLRDVAEGRADRASDALVAFIRLGQDDILQPLIDVLDEHGTRLLAELYVNCGHDRLEAAARQWAARHGYVIDKVEGRPYATWGSLGR